MKHDIVKIVLDDSYTYSDFNGWFNSLDKTEKEIWIHLAKDLNRMEHNTTLLTKKAMELYCLEMDINYIPNSHEYLGTILKRMITNLILASLLDKNLIKIVSGKLSFIKEPKFEITEKGKNYLK